VSGDDKTATLSMACLHKFLHDQKDEHFKKMGVGVYNTQRPARGAINFFIDWVTRRNGGHSTQQKCFRAKIM
jgi:hypothetical protein